MKLSWDGPTGKKGLIRIDRLSIVLLCVGTLAACERVHSEDFVAEASQSKVQIQFPDELTVTKGNSGVSRGMDPTRPVEVHIPTSSVFWAEHFQFVRRRGEMRNILFSVYDDAEVLRVPIPNDEPDKMVESSGPNPFGMREFVSKSGSSFYFSDSYRQIVCAPDRVNSLAVCKRQLWIAGSVFEYEFLRENAMYVPDIDVAIGDFVASLDGNEGES